MSKKTIGIAICNVCLKPCEIIPIGNTIKSSCCDASVVHKNMKLSLELLQ